MLLNKIHEDFDKNGHTLKEIKTRILEAKVVLKNRRMNGAEHRINHLQNRLLEAEIAHNHASVKAIQHIIRTEAISQRYKKLAFYFKNKLNSFLRSISIQNSDGS